MTLATTYPEAGKIFLEVPELGGALGAAIAVDRVLLDIESKFQKIQIVEAGQLGRMLILDQVVQTSEFDEAAYHEMIAHLPLLTHPNPERVLVIGGGDGGTLREVGKHAGLKKIEICEIDEAVIKASRDFLPGLARGFDDPRVEVHVADGARFVADHPNTYDVIMVDSSDPVGPAVVLFQSQFFEDLKKALRPGGIIVTQAESFYLYGPLIRKMFDFLKDMFERPLYYLTKVPTYPSGLIGFTFCSLGPDPFQPPDPARVAALGPLRYYTPAVGRAAFVVPGFCLDLLPEHVARAQSSW
jgi:spermidine synthase